MYNLTNLNNNMKKIYIKPETESYHFEAVLASTSKHDEYSSSNPLSKRNYDDSWDEEEDEEW